MLQKCAFRIFENFVLTIFVPAQVCNTIKNNANQNISEKPIFELFFLFQNFCLILRAPPYMFFPAVNIIFSENKMYECRSIFFFNTTINKYYIYFSREIFKAKIVHILFYLIF